MPGDCSIRLEGIGFTSEEIANCAQRKGLLSIEIELSASPNCDCRHCRSGISEPRKPMSTDEIQSVVLQAQELGCKRVILVDDERKPYPQANELRRNFRSRKLEVEYYFGMNAELSNDIRALRIPLRMDNLDDVTAKWRKTRREGITPHVQILWPQRPMEESTTSPALPGRIRNLFEELARIDREEFSQPWEKAPEYVGRSCNRHLFACHVTACGTVFACVGITIPIGDIRTTPLRTILDESEVLENLRDFHTKLKQPCHTCSKSVDCYGCRGAAYQMTGDYLAGDPLCWKTEPHSIHPLPLPVNDLIPHGPSMRMVRNLLNVGEREIVTDFQIEPDSPWVDSSGRLDDFAYIEMIAQSFAASHSFHLGADQKQPGWGLLLGVKDLIVRGDARVGDRLTIEIKKVTRFGAFGFIEGIVKRDGGEVLATAEIKLWQADDAERGLFA